MSNVHHIPQLSLDLSLQKQCIFETFYTSDEAKMMVCTLKQAIETKSCDFIYLSGAEQTGKTHLLLASYYYAQSRQINCGYLPLADFIQYSATDALLAYEHTQILLIDGLELLVNNNEWQIALFDLYNQRKEQQQLTIFSAREVPLGLEAIGLNDLKTRLEACIIFTIPELSHGNLITCLHFLADKKGLELSQQCMNFIILRAGRRVKDLSEIVDQLDGAQLQAGRKITVPFIKLLFNW